MPATTDTRQTGLIAKIVDDHTNDWEDFAGIDINVQAQYQPLDTTGGDWDIEHWSYRGQSAMCQIANGDIIRVRIGDWTNTTERDLQIQTITDPTNASQWQTWNWLGYGTNYSVAIERDDAAGSGYRIYHSKSGGLYMDNVLIASGGAAPYKIVRIKPVYGKTNMIYFATIRQGVNSQREMNWWYIENTLSVTVRKDLATYFGAYHQDLFVAKVGVSAYRFRAMPLDSGEDNPYTSDVLSLETTSTSGGYGETAAFNEYNNVQHLAGPSARSGYKRFDDLFLTSIVNDEHPDGMYYLFYTEQHLDVYDNVLSNLKKPLFWRRAKPTSSGSPAYLSAPVPTGFSVWGFGGVIATGGYVYAAGNGRVLRRPLNPTEIDITDYIPEGNYELPRDNGKAVGRLICANPNNVIGSQLGLTSQSPHGGLTERRLLFAIGNKRPSDTVFTYKRDADWFISSLRMYIDEGGRERLDIEMADFWHRLENKWKDTWFIPGRFDWADWQPDGLNQLNNYINDTDEFTSYSPDGADENTVPRLRTVASGDGPQDGTITLYTSYRDANGIVEATLWARGGIVFRYEDAENFWYVDVQSNGTYLYVVHDGARSTVASSTDGEAWYEDGKYVRVDYRFNKISVWVSDDDQEIQIIEEFFITPITGPKTGFVGLWSSTLIEVSNFTITQPHLAITTRVLLQYLLAWADQHEITFEDEEETLSAPQYHVMWGPQSDLETPEASMRVVLEAAKLNIVWRQD